MIIDITDTEEKDQVIDIEAKEIEGTGFGMCRCIGFVFQIYEIRTNINIDMKYKHKRCGARGERAGHGTGVDGDIEILYDSF